MLKYVVLGLVGALVALAVYVRLAPVNAEVWHKTVLPQGAEGDFTTAGSYTVLRDLPDPDIVLKLLDDIIMDTPRTTRVAGSLEEGKITYITRSRVFGFPDYTTIAVYPQDPAAEGRQATLAVYGRLRFGKADMGVNRARILGWMEKLNATVFPQ